MLNEEVTEEDVAEVVASWTGIPVTRLMEGEMQKLVHLEEAPARACGRTRTRRSRRWPTRSAGRAPGCSDPNRPIGSFLFLGPTGVGQDRAGARARRVPVRRRARDRARRHERVPGAAHGLATRGRASRLRRLRGGRAAHRGGPPPPVQRRPARRDREGARATCSTSCSSCSTTGGSPTARAGRSTSATRS